MSSRPLSGTEIHRLLSEVAERLGADGPPYTLVVVGGSLLALHGLRDTVSRLDAQLRAAIAAVAAAHDLDVDWCNDHAAPFVPATFDVSTCETILEQGRLAVLGAPLRDIFTMKLYRNLPNDRDDMVALWPALGFSSAQEAADAYIAAFPHAPEDPYLAELIVAIARRAGHDLPL
jgi:hypothetical protein